MTRHIVLQRLFAFIVILGLAVLYTLRAEASTLPVDELIAERAAAELDGAVPDYGGLEIKMAEGMISTGAFIQEFWIDQKTGQFIANVVTEHGETHRVWGIAIMTVNVPVPQRRMNPNEIIRIEDLTEVALPLQRVGGFAVYSAQDLVGMQVRRMLVAGRPVPRQSVVPPTVINRGQKVRIILRSNGLELSATGKALDDAHLGEMIKVVNLSSNKPIYAVATANGLVEVSQ